MNTSLGPGVSPKEAKKRDKGVFSTAGRKAGAKIRHKLGKNKANDEHADANKPASPTTSASSLPPSPNEDDFNDQGKDLLISKYSWIKTLEDL